MEVFLSWSGKRSKAVGEAMRNWLPCVLQNVKPWFSRDDIEAGAQWGEELNDKLQDSTMGVLCVTPSNTEAPWLLFEAGAIAKQVADKSRVVPYLTGMRLSDVPAGPLTRFQAKTADPADSKGTKELVTMLNTHLGEQGVEEKQLDEIFDVWWPKLAEKLKQIPADEGAQAEPRAAEEMIEEILTTVRRIDRSVESPNRDSRLDALAKGEHDGRMVKVAFKTAMNDLILHHGQALKPGEIAALRIRTLQRMTKALAAELTSNASFEIMFTGELLYAGLRGDNDDDDAPLF